MIKKLLFHFSFLLFTISYFGQTTTWDGSVWDNGMPNSTLDVVFNSSFNVNSDISAKSVTISNNSSVIVASNITFTIQDNITVNSGSSFIFENNASLLQINSLAINTGVINYRRNSTPIRKYEYTYWSSPVQNQTLGNFSPNTDTGRYHSFNTSTNSWVNETATNVMEAAKGYAIRVPSTYDPITPQIFNGEFIGTPNNGTISIPVIQFNPSLLNYNFIGNPYPSAVSVTSLFDNNSIGSLYIWTHHTPITNNNFTAADYAVRTRNTGTAAYVGGDIPGAYIGAGQGFFASSGITGNLTFTNAMRVSSNNSQFFKTNQDVLFYYFRLNATNSTGAFNQLALGYEEGATNGYDFAQDAFAQPSTPIKFYSVINGTPGDFAIQGRAYPWTLNDIIQLGYTTTVAGDYSISINDVDSFFNDKDIFIEDTSNGTFHNLKNGPLNFSSAIGTFNSRFRINYQDLSLKNTQNSQVINFVNVYKENNELMVVSSDEKLDSIFVYDVLGRMILNKNDLNQNAISLKLDSKGAVFLKVILKNKGFVTKRIVL